MAETCFACWCPITECPECGASVCQCEHDCREHQKQLISEAFKDVVKRADTLTSVVFLDIDGTLTGTKRCTKPRMNLLKLNAVQWVEHVCQVTKSKVVITSSWRKHVKSDDIKEWLSASGMHRARVVGELDVDSDDKPALIRRWLSSHPTVERYVVIDDDVKLIERLPGSMVWVQTPDAFNGTNALSAIAILMMQMPPK